MPLIAESDYFAIWCMNFEGQLRKLYNNATVIDEGEAYRFTVMPFTDFCLMVYENNPEVIDESQN